MSQIYFILEKLYVFRTVFPSIISSSRLYIRQQAYVRYCYLLASGNEMELHLVPASKQCLKFILFWENSTCFGRSFRPSSVVHDCACSNRHMSDTAICLLVGTRWNSIWFPLASSSTVCITYACCCMYSRELLMMDGKTVRNVYGYSKIK